MISESQRLKARGADGWAAAVAHPMVAEIGAGSLLHATFAPARPVLHPARPADDLGRVRPLDAIRARVLADGLHPRRLLILVDAYHVRE